jgi:biopolymer transport protein TolR
MKRYRNRRSSRSITMPEVTLTPLIDTALTLLIIFMITTPMMNNVIKVELPSSHVNEINTQEQQETIVYIDKNYRLYLNGKEMDMQTILSSLKKMADVKKIDMVFVKADGAVKYEKVIDIVDTVKMAGGIKYVALATKRAV